MPLVFTQGQVVGRRDLAGEGIAAHRGIVSGALHGGVVVNALDLPGVLFSATHHLPGERRAGSLAACFVNRSHQDRRRRHFGVDHADNMSIGRHQHGVRGTAAGIILAAAPPGYGPAALRRSPAQADTFVHMVVAGIAPAGTVRHSAGVRAFAGVADDQKIALLGRVDRPQAGVLRDPVAAEVGVG